MVIAGAAVMNACDSDMAQSRLGRESVLENASQTQARREDGLI